MGNLRASESCLFSKIVLPLTVQKKGFHLGEKKSILLQIKKGNNYWTQKIDDLGSIRKRMIQIVSWAIVLLLSIQCEPCKEVPFIIVKSAFTKVLLHIESVSHFLKRSMESLKKLNYININRTFLSTSTWKFGIIEMKNQKIHDFTF